MGRRRGRHSDEGRSSEGRTLSLFDHKEGLGNSSKRENRNVVVGPGSWSGSCEREGGNEKGRRKINRTHCICSHFFLVWVHIIDAEYVSMWTLLGRFIVHLSFSCFSVPCLLVLSSAFLTACLTCRLPMLTKVAWSIIRVRELLIPQVLVNQEPGTGQCFS